MTTGMSLRYVSAAVSSATGITEPPREREENTNRTAAETMWYNIPGGDALEVEGYINAEHSTVVYARYLSGPPLNDKDLEALHGGDLCAN